MSNVEIAVRSTVGPVVLASVIATSTPASGQEFCVACIGPTALYRCVIDQAAPGKLPLKLLCIKTLAREGGHEQCSIRAGTVFDCDAPIKRIDASAAGRASNPSEHFTPRSTGSGQSLPPAVGFAPGAPATAPPPEKVGPERRGEINPREEPKRLEPSTQPETVKEVAREISHTTQKTLDKAGKAIKSTTRKTWDCITSFFKSC